MSEYHETPDGRVRLLLGDCREVLQGLPEESVQCVVTSPPYWGLRDYGIEPSVWGGEPERDHQWGRERTIVSSAQQDNGPGGGVWNAQTRGLDPSARRTEFTASQGTFCPCGAWLGTLGLEPTPELYVAHMVEVFREVWRVLRPDATCWLNLGDSYAGSPVGAFNGGGFKDKSAQTGGRDLSGVATSGRLNKLTGSGLKPKDLVGIPWRVAFALQADGWYLRSDIIWSKPNPMPESVTDRPTKSHEYLFLLAKAERYYYDADAIREPNQGPPPQRPGKNYGYAADAGRGGNPAFQSTPNFQNPAGRNRRTVWEIATQPYPEAHFATFPTKLVEPCVLAGTSERGCCPECGAPWERVVERTSMEIDRSHNHPAELRTRTSGTMTKAPTSTTTGWRPTCGHADDPVPCVVLDPFGGSGTVAEVAYHLGRDAVIVDVKPEYLELAKARLRQGAMAL